MSEGEAKGPGTATATRDRRSLLAACFLRSVTTSLVGVLLGLHLARLDFSPAAVGIVSGSGLGGAALGALLVTRWGNRWGRRRSLIAASAVSALGGAVVAAASTPWLVAAGAFVGMVNAMGRDRGMAMVVEQAALPATVPDTARTRAFAWYGAVQDGGHALGSLLAAAPALLSRHTAIAEVTTNRLGLAALPIGALASCALYLTLSRDVEAASPAARAGGQRALTPATRRILWRLSVLFSIDGLGGGLLVTSLLSYFFFERFAAPPGAVAVLFAAARTVNLVSNFAAAWLARRIGLVNTMVFTHIPSSLLLLGVAFVPTFSWAALLFLLREAVAKMDVPTRQSYVMALVEPEARVAASGLTNLVRLASWAFGPLVAGALMQSVGLAAPLLVGASVKIAYDLALWAAFRHLRPPEEC